MVCAKDKWATYMVYALQIAEINYIHLFYRFL